MNDHRTFEVTILPKFKAAFGHDADAAAGELLERALAYHENRNEKRWQARYRAVSKTTGLPLTIAVHCVATETTIWVGLGSEIMDAAEFADKLGDDSWSCSRWWTSDDIAVVNGNRRSIRLPHCTGKTG